MTARVAPHFAAFARTASPRAPLYARLGAGLAVWPGLEDLYADAPGTARVPVNLFAAVHYLLLADRDAPLARFYPNLAGDTPATGDPVPAFLEYCNEHSAEIRALVATRLPQTNETGRSALLVAGFDRLPAGPKAHLDVGASAGLSLMLDRFAYDDGNRVLGDSALLLECSVLPPGRPLADRLPEVTSRLGLDRRPLDLTDPDDTRWLEACVWPDQADRFHRLERAVELFLADPVPVRQGDAVDDLADAVASLGPGEPVVTTSWALSYLDPVRQHAFVEELDRLGGTRDLAWVWAESPELVPALPVDATREGDDLTVLGVSTWSDGVRSDRTLARCHPHGYWLHWLD
ncbi:MAG: DUF2332 domain-containing protein [Propionicimonas sp.]|uniref:DUF2332 domain-containing protein n=1 Tax=Propionicimonas sp. TaxID=1955623 RepID=UPI003D0B8EB3